MEQKRNIVDLINQLAEYAVDENTTKEAIDGILGQIRSETNDSNKKEISEAEKESEKNESTPVFNDNAAVDEIRRVLSGNDAQILEQLDKEQKSHYHNMSSQIQPPGMFIFTRIREVKSPSKAHPTDAGIDFYVPDAKAWDEEFKSKVIQYSRNESDEDVMFIDGSIIVQPNAHVAIPSGIKTILPKEYGMMFVNKSGVATKMKLDHSACLVDSEYRNEIVMCFFNHSKEEVKIEPGMKITQGLIVPIVNLEIQEVLNRVYETIGQDSDRGGGFGSSGTN